MPEGQVLEFSAVTKRFGGVTAVSELSARVQPGMVTGFLGPNGAGKTTSLRMLLGLVRPTAGTATIGGVSYAKLPRPLQTVGAVLEASSFHPGRSGAAHLTVYAQAAGLPRARVDEVLGLVGLSDAAGRKVGGYSLGMRQRLGLAYALLGDPGVLVLDEPTNGLDPEGIRWIRGFLRQLAREGRTVFVSSHLLAEVQQTVDSLLIISQGRLVFQGGLDELSDPAEQATVVDSTDRKALADALAADGIPFEVLRSGLTVRGIDTASVGRAAAAAGVALTVLQKRGPALEEVFLDLVNGTRVHTSATAGDTIPALPVGGTDAAAETLPGSDDTPDSQPASLPGSDDTPDSQPGSDDTSDSDRAPVADADAVSSVAAELDAESSGAAPAAAMGAAAGADWAEGAEGAEDRPAPASRHSGFAVASTGVIDIVTVDDEEPTPEPEHPAFAVASTGVIDIVTAEQQAQASTEQSASGDDSAGGEASDPVDDRPWDPYVKTDADLDADRFFAAFDDAANRAPDDVPSDHTDDREPRDDDQAAHSDDDHADRDDEGGETR
ncbi:ATP-binding cassette domain-containing protein [Microbacterium sp. NPDC057407]|uniref:ATP-binding cassette domain-containing protein n=1 Tax=Microbacterium sp. NPDC057407 TaxID=3346120 RepID=UPI00366B4788